MYLVSFKSYIGNFSWILQISYNDNLDTKMIFLNKNCFFLFTCNNKLEEIVFFPVR